MIKGLSILWRTLLEHDRSITPIRGHSQTSAHEAICFVDLDLPCACRIKIDVPPGIDKIAGEASNFRCLRQQMKAGIDRTNLKPDRIRNPTNVSHSIQIGRTAACEPESDNNYTYEYRTKQMQGITIRYSNAFESMNESRMCVKPPPESTSSPTAVGVYPKIGDSNWYSIPGMSAPAQ